MFDEFHPDMKKVLRHASGIATWIYSNKIKPVKREAVIRSRAISRQLKLDMKGLPG